MVSIRDQLDDHCRDCDKPIDQAESVHPVSRGRWAIGPAWSCGDCLDGATEAIDRAWTPSKGRPWKEDDGNGLQRGGPDDDPSHRTLTLQSGMVKCQDCEKKATSEEALNRTPCKP